MHTRCIVPIKPFVANGSQGMSYKGSLSFKMEVKGWLSVLEDLTISCKTPIGKMEAQWGFMMATSSDSSGHKSHITHVLTEKLLLQCCRWCPTWSNPTRSQNIKYVSHLGLARRAIPVMTPLDLLNSFEMWQHMVTSNSHLSNRISDHSIQGEWTKKQQPKKRSSNLIWKTSVQCRQAHLWLRAAV